MSNAELSEGVKTVLSPYGTISGVKTTRDHKNRPFAFVQFEGPIVDFMLNEVVTIEDRVLRFEKAKSLLKIDGNDGQSVAVDGHNQSYETSAAYHHTNADQYFIHPPQGYVPYYYHHTQKYSTFHVPQPYNTNTNKNKNLNPNYQMYRRFESSPVSFEGSPDEIPNKMFVGHLNGELVTQRKLLRHFQRHGHITDIELFKKHLDGSLRLDAFAFISYLKAEEVIKAIEEEDGKLWLGRILKCCQALKKRENASGSGSGSDSFDGKFRVNPSSSFD